ncbi:leucyl-tRNA synthetase [Coniochaeta ligniaria NRRL 30616]|uniref:leucine--tRNA ligase n=1 Tax=Coniochaeta ligniaria NRRL 30616 TaxID=1408157 RepID=A0A1J7IQZ0_9PEZI|nr:leucyl-tRNA synthetase [Coniochaeta ligniaria NRRL 30616]
MQPVYGRLIAHARLPTSSIRRSCGHAFDRHVALKPPHQALRVLTSRRSYATQQHLNLPALDKKWQQKWQSLRSKPPVPDKERSMYILPMFPYPSGQLHMGHLRVYTIADVMARFRALQGNSVLLPMGWDAFGLPAENAAIERGVNPAVWTRGNIARMKEQLGAMNGSWDWDNEIATCDPEFYKHTQRIFLMLYEQGLAYRAEAEVNYDPVDKTVLANEQVDASGRSWRSGAKVEKRTLEQWFLRISEFREELLGGLDRLGQGDAWPERVLAMQKNWLGKSTGARINFPLLAFKHDVGAHVEVFTTRPDTLFGVQYLALAATHPIVAKLAAQDPELQAFLDTLPGLPPDSKVGYMLPHIRAINPLAYHDSTPMETKQSIPVYVAPYVLGDYGEGAVMGVPGHDVRDHAFWREHHYDEPIRVVLSSSDDESTTAMLNEPYLDHGTMTAYSGPYKGKSSKEAGKMIVAMLEEAGLAKPVEKWRLRDWLVSRQRYWGAPIPIVHCGSCGPVPVPEDQLPVELPEVDDHWAERKAGNPLESQDEWVNTSCPKCGGAAKRDTDTMDTFVDSSWYYMRFIDAHNEHAPFSAEKVRQFLPVDLYIGGIEHAILHLLYARFIYKFLMKSPLVSGDKQEGLHEPFKRLITQGMVQGKTYTDPATGRFLKPEEVDVSDLSKPVIIATGKRPNVSFEKMSKSKYNGVDPTDFIARYGADATRAHMIFQAPVGDTLNWDEEKISGVTRWLHKLHDLVAKAGKLPEGDGAPSSAKEHLEKQIAHRSTLSSEDATRLDADAAVWREVQKTIDSVTASYEKVYALNTVVSDLMILTNTISSHLSTASHVVLKDALSTLIRMSAPITPAFAEECWTLLNPGSKSVFGDASFPVTDGTMGMLQPRKQNCAVQVNGKLKVVVEIPTAPEGMEGDELRDWVVGEVMKTEEAKAKLGGVMSAKTVRVVRGGKLVNFVL